MSQSQKEDIFHFSSVRQSGARKSKRVSSYLNFLDILPPTRIFSYWARNVALTLFGQKVKALKGASCKRTKHSYGT